jgi:hypothetical protein
MKPDFEMHFVAIQHWRQSVVCEFAEGQLTVASCMSACLAECDRFVGSHHVREGAERE